MRNLTDLTQEELKALFKANKHLQEQAQERLLENAFYWIEEELYSFNKIQGVEYSISCYYDYFNVKYPDTFPDFFEAVKDIQKDYCILEDVTMALVDRAAEKIEFFRDCYNNYEDISANRYKHLEKWIFGIVDRVTSEYIKYFQSDIYSCYEYENQLNYFLDCPENFEEYETDGQYIYKTVCYA